MAEIFYTADARIRMQQGEVDQNEVREVLQSGILSSGQHNKWVREKVFTAGYQRRGRNYPNKEVRVIYVEELGVSTVIITVRARFGRFEAINCG